MELSGTASAASGNLPWVRADKKNSVNARTRPLDMMSGELSVPDRSGTEAGGSPRTFPQKPGWLHLGLETFDSSKGGWRRAAGGGLGARLDTTTRVTLQGHAWVTPRSISGAGSRRRRRGGAVVARELPKKNESGGAQRQTGDSGEKTLENRGVRLFFQAEPLSVAPRRARTRLRSIKSLLLGADDRRGQPRVDRRRFLPRRLPDTLRCTRSQHPLRAHNQQHVLHSLGHRLL